MWIQCTKCKKHKPLWAFNKSKRYSFGIEKKCKKCRKEYNKQHYQKIKDVKKEKAKQYYIDNKKIINKRNNEWYKENKDKVAKNSSKWKKNNKCKVNGYNAKRRVQQRENYIELTKEEQALSDKYYKVCEFLGNDKYNVDHKTPVKLGGSNHPSNLQILTKFDNLSKGAKLNYECTNPRITLQ